MNKPTLIVRPMEERDLAQVMAIEEAVFVGDPWPRSAFERQLDNALARFVVLAQADATPEAAPACASQSVLAYAGLWIVVDEAHLMNIAVDPALQGQGLGEFLLLHMLEQARALGAELCTLEVRPSNRRAQRLYRRLGFHVAGRRRRYYVDNGEDALIMTSEALALLASRHRERLAAVCQRLQPAYDFGVDKAIVPC